MFPVCLKMSALELLHVYCSGEESSGEEFTGFSGDPASEQFPSTVWRFEKFEDFLHSHPESSVESHQNSTIEQVLEIVSESPQLEFSGRESPAENAPEPRATLYNRDDSSGHQVLMECSDLGMNSGSAVTLDSDGRDGRDERKRKRTKKKKYRKPELQNLDDKIRS